LRWIGLDKLEALYNLDEPQLQKIIECSDVLVKKKELELEIKNLDKEIDNLKSNRDYYRLEVAKSGQVKLQLE
jgi:chorismate mutase